MSNSYDKMNDYIISVFNVYQMVNKKAQTNKDLRLKMIGLAIYNYVLYMSKEYEVELKDIQEPDEIILIPIFEYISCNNIELLDFSNINMNDIDISKKEDLERFVLSHIYYITQN
jgi:hypothetical protein